MAQLDQKQIEEILNNNGTLKEINGLDMNGLIDRYISKEPIKYVETFNNTLNKRDSEGFAINYILFNLRGKNLEWIFKTFASFVPTLKKYGYYLNVERIVEDMEKILSDFEPYIEEDIDNGNIKDTTNIDVTEDQFNPSLTYMNPTVYVVLATQKMQQILKDVKNELCFVTRHDTGNNI